MIIDNDFVVLDAGTTVGAALKKMEEIGSYHIIIIRDDEYFLYDKYTVFDELEYADANDTLDDGLVLDLSDFGAVAIAAKDLDDSIDVNTHYVVLENGKVIGCLPGMGEPEDAGAEPSTGGGLLPGGGNTPDTRGGSTSGTPQFSAYPSISDPGEVAPNDTFKLYVGFSSELDAALEDVQKIEIDKPDAGEMVYVSVIGFGVEIANSISRPLPLIEAMAIPFDCTVKPDAKAVEIQAYFVYKNHKVGEATRKVKMKGAAAPENKEKNVGAAIDGKATNVDITLIVKHDSADHLLHWLVVSDTSYGTIKAQTKVSDTRAFAAELQRELGAENFVGRAARNSLHTLGQKITDVMPPDFFAIVEEKVGLLGGALPSVLILTDEPYIPWELAKHKSFKFNADAPPFLATQTKLGRWWSSPSVKSLPPESLDVSEIKALAAHYDFASGYDELKEASKEKAFLEDKFEAVGLAATKKAVLDLSEETNIKKGLLVHMALHGESDPRYDEQKIILEDGTLRPSSMIGPYEEGSIPPISFLFLNACQVGTAGQSLGQASGFPGVLLKKGMLGFIAPLWKVHDVQARQFAEYFYTQCLEEERPIAEVLQELRAEVDYEASLTPLAYMYYGHPSMRLLY